VRRRIDVETDLIEEDVRAKKIANAKATVELFPDKGSRQRFPSDIWQKPEHTATGNDNDSEYSYRIR
jgi:hypothetical protein